MFVQIHFLYVSIWLPHSMLSFSQPPAPQLRLGLPSSTLTPCHPPPTTSTPLPSPFFWKNSLFDSFPFIFELTSIFWLLKTAIKSLLLSDQCFYLVFILFSKPSNVLLRSLWISLNCWIRFVSTNLTGCYSLNPLSLLSRQN